MKSKLTEGWKEVKLIDITKKIGSGATPRGGAKVYIDEGISLIRSQNVLDFKFSTGGLVCIDEYASEKLNNVEVLKNDILINITGDSVARTCLVPDYILPARVNQHVSIVRTDEELSYYKYIGYKLQDLKKLLLSYSSSGATRKALTKSMLENLKINLPTIKEQKAIADTLSSLDDKIELNNKINENLENQAQAIFKHWFVDFEFPDEDGKPYKSSGGQMIDSELGMIPEGWDVVELIDIAERKNGYSYKSIDMNEESNSKLLTLKNFNRNGGYDNSHYRRIDITDRVRDHHYVQDSEILLACTDLTQNAEVVGNPIMYFSTGRFDKALLSMDLVKIVPKKSEHNLYIYYVLKSRNFKEYAKNHSTGTTVLHFKKKSIDQFEMLKPSEKLIKNFTEIVIKIESKIINNLKQNYKLSQLRDTLLPKLMSGEIRIPLD